MKVSAHEVFHAVCDLPPGEREAELARRCGDDDGLRREVEELLRADADPLTALDRSPARAFLATDVPERIGEYEILSLLGSGGMGVVYEAMQRSPHRRVALKVIRSMAIDPEHVRRFEQEAAVLGRLNHPGIATVYEAGTVEVDGARRPYLAMELVLGLPLDRHVREAGLGVRERVELVARVADAVHHAHQQGVIHRDLKPGNVLVDGSGRPKVLDFGIARMTGSGAATRHTGAGELLGTLPYMSPEQVQGDPTALDGRSDVYALGVVLYEVLCGRKPHDVGGRLVAEAVRSILEEEPAPLGAVDPALRGDLEVIVHKALEKEKERRYGSVAELAADLRRFLDEEPIQARPTSTAYQLRKFVRRNTALVAGLATAFLAMAVGTAVATWQARAARSARARADEDREVAVVEAYRGNLSAVQGSLEVGDVEAARRFLERVPSAQRGWEWRHLENRLDRAAAVVAVPGAVDAALDAEGRLVVVAPDGAPPGSVAVRWLEPVLGRELSSVRLPTPDALKVALSADGSAVAALHGPGSRRVTLWRLGAAGAAERVLDGELDGPGLELALSADGGTVAATSAGSARIWRPDTPRPITWVHGTTPRSIAVSASGSHVGIVHEADGSSAYGVFDVVTGTAACDLGRDVLGLTLSPDGAYAATSESDGVLRLRQLTTGRVLQRFRSPAAEVGVAAFDAAGHLLAVAGSDGATRVWSLANPHTELGEGGIEFAVRPDAVLPGTASIRRIAFDPAGPRLVTLDDRGNARLHEIAPDGGPTLLLGHVAPVVDVAVSPDGSLLVTGSGDGTLRFWDGASGVCFAGVPCAEDLRTLAFSPDGRTLATGHRGEVRLLEVARPLHPRHLDTGAADVLAVAFAPDGRRLATLDAEGRTALWDLAGGDRLFEVRTGPLEEGDLAFSPSGRALATSGPGELIVLDASSGERVASRRVEGARLTALAWLAPAELVASGWSDGTIRVFERDLGHAGAEMRSSGAAIASLAAFPGGTRLAAGSAGGVLEVWDVPTRRTTLELVRSGSGITSLAVFPDGSRLVGAASGSNVVSVWDTVPTRARLAAAARLAEVTERLRGRVLAHFARTADPIRVAEVLWRDESLDEEERRAALRLTVAPPPPDHGVRHDPYDGYALAFDGADDHVVAEGDEGTLRMTDAFTVEAWARPGEEPSRSTLRTIVNKEGEYQIVLWPGGELHWLVAGPDGWMPHWIPVRYSAEPGRWTHVALVRDGAEIRFFVNGRRVQTYRGPERIGDHHPTMNELRIGGRQHSSQGFSGEIDEVRVWNVARTEEEIRSTLQHRPRPDEPGLVSCWSFDDGSGTVASDATGRHPGRIVGARWCATASDGERTATRR